ncbi:ABC-three component system protein [Pseudomonas amygdali]|uniref:ABC-three component system protein n=1 Tax=Pseudomonas amygdali TaxID=47877 RepID=UPI003B39FFFF
MRRSSSGALTFILDWTAELTLLSVQAHRLVDDRVTADIAPVALEFHELFDRYPPYPGYLAAVKNELDLLNTLVQGTGLPDYSGFTYRTRFGVRVGEHFPLAKLSSAGECVMRTVQALSYLNVPVSSQWSCTRTFMRVARRLANR